MNCDEIREYIDDLPPEDLRDPSDPGMKTHLAGCAACREYRDKSIALTNALDCWDIPKPRKSIQAGVMTAVARLERERRAAAAVPGSFWDQVAALFRYRFQVPAMAAACLLVLLGVSLVLNIVQYGESPERVPPPTAVAEGSIGAQSDIRTVSDGAMHTVEEDTRSGKVVIYEPDTDRLLDLRQGPLSVPIIVILGAPPRLPLESGTERRPDRAKPITEPREDKI